MYSSFLLPGAVACWFVWWVACWCGGGLRTQERVLCYFLCLIDWAFLFGVFGCFWLLFFDMPVCVLPWVLPGFRLVGFVVAPFFLVFVGPFGFP